MGLLFYCGNGLLDVSFRMKAVAFEGMQLENVTILLDCFWAKFIV